MPFRIIRNDITKVQADVIVNTANPRPTVGGGTDSAVYRAAGERELLAERRKIGDIAPGNAAVTPAFGLNARYIIHTVGPVWVDGRHGEHETLRACYDNSLALAAELKAESIAFPLIATGVYGYPKDKALNIAMEAIGRFLLTHDMQVTMVVFSKSAFEISRKLVDRIDEYIDEHAVWMTAEAEYGRDVRGERARRIRRILEMERLQSGAAPESFADKANQPFPDAPAQEAASALSQSLSLDEFIGKTGETFQQRLFQLIDKSGMDDVTVYRKANIDRKVFSKIRCNMDYKPKKTTAVAFAIALELDMPAMKDLLARAGIALSPSNRFDLIISYFVENKDYDMFRINSTLFDYGQPLLGSQAV